MVKYVFDSNIFIALESVNYFEIIEKFFSDSSLNDELIVSKSILKECSGRAFQKKIQRIHNFYEDENKYPEFIETLRDASIKILNKTIHTSKGNEDYLVIASAIKNNAEIIVTNDYDIRRFFERYNRNTDKLNIDAINLSAFLKVILETRPDLSKSLYKLNLELYSEVNLPGIYAQLYNAKKFISNEEKKEWLKNHQKTFREYKENILLELRGA